MDFSRRDLGKLALAALPASKLLAAKKATVMAVRLLDHLPEHPILTIDRAAKLLKTTLPTTTKAIGVLEDLGILVETTGRRRDRAFSYRAYLDRLRAGTELEEGAT